MNRAEIRQTVYPYLPDIVDQETLLLITHLDPKEREFVLQAKHPRHQYLKAVYLKTMRHFGHCRYDLTDIPRLIRLKMAEQLDLSKEFANIATVHPVEKSRIIQDVRTFLGIKPYTRKDRPDAEKYLKNGLAHEENNIIVLINAVINWFKESSIEIPSFSTITSIAQYALNAANISIQKNIKKHFKQDHIEKIELLLKKRQERTLLDYFKDDFPKPSSVNMLSELERIRELKEYLFENSAIRKISKQKIEYFAQIGDRYTSSEIAQFNTDKRLTVLHCFLFVRRSLLLDALAEAFIRIWQQIKAAANYHADDYRETHIRTQSEYEFVLQDILDFICDSASDQEMIARIRNYMTPEEYKSIRNTARRNISWKECYYQKIKDHYTTLRRFLPQWYQTIPMISTTADDGILNGVKFIVEYDKFDGNSLPVPDISFDFLSAEWQRRSLVKHSWDGSVQMIHKTPFELGIVDSIASALKDGRESQSRMMI